MDNIVIKKKTRIHLRIYVVEHSKHLESQHRSVPLQCVILFWQLLWTVSALILPTFEYNITAVFTFINYIYSKIYMVLFFGLLVAYYAPWILSLKNCVYSRSCSVKNPSWRCIYRSCSATITQSVNANKYATTFCTGNIVACRVCKPKKTFMSSSSVSPWKSKTKLG